MESFGNLESFVRSAEAGSFAAAARTLGVSSAAVSKNVARLEASLGVLLFQRSTRSLTLTEAGERFLEDVSGGLETIRSAVATLTGAQAEPAGLLRVSLPIGLGMEQLLPIVGAFAKRYPRVVPELHFENRQVDLIAEGLDVAIGGAIELNPGVVARELARVHVVAVASPELVRGDATPAHPSDLAALPAIVMRSVQSGRVAVPVLRNRRGEEATVPTRNAVIVDDPEAMCRCAAMGLGVTIAPLTQAADYLDRGELVRLLPDWHADVGSVFVYVSSRRLLPSKTRVFIDFLVEHFKKEKLARRFSAV
ncbi:MAG: LysR family transcriptional regulator [Labilithrix sp.]|nr:LysR family transcriptional regulator [Labilithrix sp.]